MSLYASWFDSDSLRHKLLRWVMIPLVILVLLNIALIYKLGRESADRMHDHFLMEASRILLDQLSTVDGQVVLNLHSGALSMLYADRKDRVYYSLSGVGQSFQFGPSDLPLPRSQVSEIPTYYMASYDGRPVRMMAAIMPETDVASGKVLVLLAKTLVLHHEHAEEWMWRVLPSQIFLTVFAGVIIWWGVGRGLRPLLQLQGEVTRRSSLDLSPLPEDKVVTEVRPLIRGFNELMGRLDESLVLQRRFVADAAHQLRTPLTGLKAQAELALRLDEPLDVRHSLLQMRRAANHAAHLANQLLALARAEPSTENQESLVKLDWVALARSTTEYWVPKALRKNIDLGFEGTDRDCRITGNRLLLGEMLNNLIDNALRYTQNGGLVTVRIDRQEDNVVLEVEDNGPGVAENQRERVFERFYSVLGTNQNGCGLGLAIVREIADRHHAKVLLLSGAGGVGTLMRVVFPLDCQRL